MDAMRFSGRRLLETELRGVAGTSKNAFGRVSAFRFAGITFENPIVDFANATGGTFARRDVAGIIGAEILQPACGACANCGPGSSTAADQVTISAINRNFAGRSGPGQVWLASPPTVAASAIAGEIVSFAELQERYGGCEQQAV